MKKIELKRLQTINLKSTGIAIIVMMIAFVLLITVLMLQQVKLETIENLEDSMISVLQTTDESLKLWINEQIQRLDYDLQDSYFRTVLQEVVLHEKNRVLYRVEMSRYLREKKNHLLDKPYYVVSQDFEILASNMEQKIGTTIPMREELANMDNLEITFKTSFIPPFDIVSSDGTREHVLFYVSPIFNNENQWIGFFILEENPKETFTRICQIGRFDETGETYAFNKSGTLLSNSRFTQELMQSGYINNDKDEILTLQIKNFGHLDETGHQFENVLQYTTSGKININMGGYKDYRDVDVFGIWIWNNVLNFGLATEIDVADALSSYYNYRSKVIIIVIISLIIAGFSITYTIATSLRQTRKLELMNNNLETKIEERTKELTKANIIFDSAINALTHPFYVIDTISYEILVSNEAFRKDLGAEKKFCYEAIHKQTAPCNTKKYSCPLRRVMESGESVVMNHIHYDAEGKELLVELHAYPIYDEAGNIVQMIGYYEDITERIVAEMETTKALDRVEKLYQASASLSQSLDLESVLGNILDHLRDVVPFESASIQKYEAGIFKILYCTGFKNPENVIGKEFEASTDTINDRIVQSRKPMIINDVEQYEEFDDLTLEKSITSWMGIPLIYQGEIIGELTLDSSSDEFYTDEMADLGSAFAAQAAIALHNASIVEELNIARQIAEKATKAKSDFLANMSHEIRTPMNAIIGFGDLLIRTHLNDKQFDYVDKIAKASKNLLGIINDILDFSKIEAGKLDFESIPFNLEETLNDMSDVVSMKAYNKGIEFTIFREKCVPHMIIGDPQRLYQILLNLTNNAIKFTEKGEVVIRISCEEETEDQILLKFEVADTGIGMSEDHLQKLFSAFSQADTSITRKYGGTGLGLTITKNLCRMMHGSIDVKSIYEQGSTFTVKLPFKRADEIDEPVRIIPENLANLKLAVVEDNYTAMEVYKNYLEDFPSAVQYFTNAEAFLKAFEKESFNVVIMDFKLPGMNGIQAWKALKKNNYHSDQLPKIIMATAYGKETIIEEATASGIDIILMKPVTYSTLFDAVIHSLEGDKYISKRYSKVKEMPDVDDLKGKRILLVEDNEINQQVAVENLEEIGINVDVADNGEIALEMINNSEIHYDIVLMDLQMPVMDGITATRELRRKYTPEELPIIALTADVMKDTVQRTLENGMQAHVPKPIDFAGLLELLSKILTGKEIKIDLKSIDREIDNEELNNLQAFFKEFEVQKAVERLNGNVQLYKKTLNNFATKYTGFEETIKKAYEDHDYASLRREFHTLKGLSATLGLYQISEQAKKFEMLASNDHLGLNREMVSETYTHFMGELERNRQKIANYTVKESDQTIQAISKMTEKEFEETLNNLGNLLDSFDTESENLLKEIKGEFVVREDEPVYNSIEKAVEDYDFEKAIEILNDYLSTL